MASIEDADNYVVNASCECSNRYQTEPPCCLGLIKKPGNAKAKRIWARRLRREDRVGPEVAAMHIDIKDIQFVEVEPSDSVSKYCKGHENYGYPIISTKDSKPVIAVIQRLHYETEGNDDKVRNPDCENTHAVIIIVLPRVVADPTLNPHKTLVQLIGGAKPTRHGVTQCSLIEKLECSHGLIDESDLPDNLKGRSWNFGLGGTKMMGDSFPIS